MSMEKLALRAQITRQVADIEAEILERQAIIESEQAAIRDLGERRSALRAAMDKLIPTAKESPS